MKIDNFREKWKFFSQGERPLKLSPEFFPCADSVQIHEVASKFPARPTDPFPASDANASSIKPQAFSNWLRGDLPKLREASFERLTGLKLTVWALPRLEFEATVRREIGESAKWADLIRRAEIGQIVVKVADATASTTRFIVAGTPASGRQPTKAWAGCTAWVEIPVLTNGDDGSDWRAWLIAEYAPEIFALDPCQENDGTPTSSKVKSSTRRLPRNSELTIGSEFAPGRTFDTVVLAFDLSDQAPIILDQVNGLERELVRPPRRIDDRASHYAVRGVLDRAAALFSEHDVQHFVWREPCVVVQVPRRA